MNGIKQPKCNVHIRWMIRRDMPEVCAIECDAFGVYAWSEEDFIRCLRQRNAIGMVADKDDIVAGFMIYELNRSYLQILNFAVHADCRRCDIATQFMQKLIGKLAPQRRNRIVIDVRESNLAMQLFLKAMGFLAYNVVEGYYDETDEAAYMFEYRLEVA